MLTRYSPALENATLSDLVAMDNTYLSRLSIRRQLIQDQRREIIACKPQAVPAVMELYEWLIGTYLPRRFPSVYSIVRSSDSEKAATHLKNHATNTLLPLQASSPDLALQILGENIDTEFLLLQKQPESTPTPEPYRLTAFINCFPAGFSTLSKLGLSLAAIHSPVPHYAEKLEKSMDRYFASLPVGKIVKRANWSISTTGDLFCLDGHHMSEQERETPQERKRQEDSVHLDKTVVRCERQTLHRLPKTGALVFAFKVCLLQTRTLVVYNKRVMGDETVLIFFSLLFPDIPVSHPPTQRRGKRTATCSGNRWAGPGYRAQNHSV
jgi:hypothetical protein